MTNFFTGAETNLPKLDMSLPKIKKGLPKIQMENSENLFFEIDGQNISMAAIADKLSNLFLEG